MPTPKDKKQAEQLSLLKEHRAQLTKLQKSTTLDTLKAIEDKVLEDSVNVVIGVLGFADLGFDADGKPVYPEHWGFLTPEDKAKRVRLATMGNMPSADIPHGVKLAHATMLGIIKARAQTETGTKVLNIEHAVFPAPAPLNQQIPPEEILEIED